ncbi:MAG: iron-only hydrogenase system regulator [Clostridiales bacterium]|nr:iron-only hydrogenase system regulator [Clostridiales bacterium]
MDTRVALIGIVVEDSHSIKQLNQILHQYGTYIIGRMGLPYPKRQVNIISIAIDAPADVISALAGKLGRLPGVSSKAVYSKLPAQLEERGDMETKS